MELVGLGYTGWFVYRYLLFKVNPRDYNFFFFVGFKIISTLFIEFVVLGAIRSVLLHLCFHSTRNTPIDSVSHFL